MNITHNNLSLNRPAFKAQINHTNNLKVIPSSDLFIKSATLEPRYTPAQISFTGVDALRQLEINNIFKPIKELEPIIPALKGKVKEIKVPSTDGITLNCWHIEAKEDKPTILFCHGNNRNITLKQDVAQFLSDNGYGVLMADYRGYGANPGTPTEEGLYDDAQASLDYINNELGIETKDVYLWGHSLGGGIASELAVNNKFKGVILDSTFTNIIDMTKDTIIKVLEKADLPLKNKLIKLVQALPDKAFSAINPKFDNIKKVDQIDSPLLVLHSKEDDTVPYQMSEQLASKHDNCKLLLSEKGGHSDHEWAHQAKIDFFEG